MIDPTDESTVNITDTIKAVDVGSVIFAPATVAGIRPGSVPISPHTA